MRRSPASTGWLPRAGLSLAALLALASAGCRTNLPPAATLAVRLHCPVTLPRPSEASEPGLANALAEPYGWYGNAALRVAIPDYGLITALHPVGTPWASQWGIKFLWWRLVPGNLAIRAHRLGGPSAGFRSQIPSGYGQTGFIPSGLILPAPGCWQLTGTVAGQSLTFVLLVRAGAQLR